METLLAALAALVTLIVGIVPWIIGFFVVMLAIGIIWFVFVASFVMKSAGSMREPFYPSRPNWRSKGFR